MHAITGHGAVTQASGQVGDGLAELTGALHHELRLIAELRRALQQQRDGVASDDAEAIEDSVHAIGRTLFTLEEARRRRIGVTTFLTGDRETVLDDLEGILGRALPGPLAAARDQLRREAAATAHDVAINQTMLRRALEAGDAYLQQLFASAGDPTPAYTAGPRSGEARPGAMLLNRTA